jgi:hypothetical protein
MNPVSPTTGVRGRKAFMWLMAVLLCAIVGAGIHAVTRDTPLANLTDADSTGMSRAMIESLLQRLPNQPKTTGLSRYLIWIFRWSGPETCAIVLA